MFQKPNCSGIQVGAKEMTLKLRGPSGRQMPQRAASHATGGAMAYREKGQG